jgi:hypothetical protein
MIFQVPIKSIKLVIKSSPGRGMGLHVVEAQSKGTIIDVSCSWELSPPEIRLMDTTSIEGYWFDHPAKPGWGLFPVGLAGMINHSIESNAILKWVENDNRYWGVLELTKDVESGDEVFINYDIELPEDWIS